MNKLPSSKIEETASIHLVELINLIEGGNDTIEDWKKAFPKFKDLRYELIDNVKKCLTNIEYEGPNKYDLIYSFVKGYNKRLDNDFFSTLKQRAIPLGNISIDKADEFNKKILRERFNEKIKDENIRNIKYKKLLDELINEKPILKPLPPKEMIPLKPYHEKLFEANNNEFIDFINHFGHDFNSKDDNNLLVNMPNDYEKAVELLNKVRNKYTKDYEIVKKSKNENDPIFVYYLNNIHKLEDAFEFLENIVYKQERKPFKLTFYVKGIFEHPIKSNNGETIDYEYKDDDVHSINNNTNYSKMSDIPIIIQSKPDLDKTKLYLESILHNYEVSESSVKLTFISSLVFKVHRMVKVTGKIDKLPQEFINSNLIIVDNENDGLCWYRFLAVSLNVKLINRCYKIKDRTAAAKKLLCEERGYPYVKNPSSESLKIISEFKGMTEEEMKESAKKHELNVNIYKYDEENKIYDLADQWFIDEKFNTSSALLFTKDLTIHIMYIKEPEKLTNLMICPKCHSRVFRNKNRMGEKRLNAHIKVCDGKFKKEYISERESLPYCPHILENPVYEYCLAHELEFKPQRYYFTYDFETMEKIINEKVSNSTVIKSHLIPLSVSVCVKSESINETKNFDVRRDHFIIRWIEYMFDKSIIVIKDKIKFYSEMLKIDDIERLKLIVRDLDCVCVLGFNSSRFDSNLFKQYLNQERIIGNNKFSWYVKNESLIGTSSSFKQLVIYSPETKTSLKFIDAQAFVGGNGTLEQFGVDFGGIDNSIKGTFPYEAINDLNYDKLLNKSEPFPHEAFYSSLKGKNTLTAEQYEIYKEDAKNYATRWDYLISYNNNDVNMMIKPIDNLIDQFGKYKIDMLSNLSLPKCATSIKYSMAYKKFNPNEDYEIINKENTFKPTLKWFSFKCSQYQKQDEDYNKTHKNSLRNIEKCVNEDDFDEFMKMYNDSVNGKCHLCGEHFTYENKPTLDRINNDIGHEIGNCKLACSSCNIFRNRNDDKVSKLRIQLKKYCHLHHLPTTISDEDEYFRLRAGISGGISSVLHRYNLRGVTKINKSRFNEKTLTVENYDLPYTMTHICGIDFNSLYPSVYSSTFHHCMQYHNGVMYMPGSLVKTYKCYDEDGKRNDKIYEICNSIIHSNNRYKDKPKYIFRAEVKLECPIDKINDLINLPPVFRSYEIDNKEEVIGSYMYQYGKKNDIRVIDKKTSKLTLLIDTMNQFMHFSNYYLWLLIDLGLKVIDIKNLSLYEANRAFNPFVNEFMNERIDIISGKKKGNEKFYKLSMNSSYGYDGMNAEKYSKIKVCNKDKTYEAIISDTYINGTKLNDNFYLVQSNPKTFRCKTPLQVAFFTLDYSKFWYLNFLYNYLFKCIDKNRFHITTVETDAIYFAISGDLNKPISQGFDEIITDNDFYQKYIYHFMPNPIINSVKDTKKILGCCVEKYGENQIALCPKCYTIFNNETDTKTKALKVKGVSLKNNNIISSDYKDIIDNGTIKSGLNVNLQMKNSQMSKLTITKNALTGYHNKGVLLITQACLPFININNKQLSSYNYIISNQ